MNVQQTLWLWKINKLTEKLLSNVGELSLHFQMVKIIVSGLSNNGYRASFSPIRKSH